MRRFPALDGLRAVSISLVLLRHFNPVVIPGLWRIDYGNFGVRVFFVISGFLITSLLLTDEIRLGKFYARRFARIMPAYWLYLAVVAALIPTGLALARYRDLLPSFFYVTNYVPVGAALGATWSLAVEEQFYLLWPAALKLGKRTAIWVCLAVLLLAPAFRLLADVGVWPTDTRYAFEGVFDALASGCLLALVREQLWSLPTYRRLLKYAFFAPVIVLIALAVYPSRLAADILGISVLNLSVVVAMDHMMRSPSVVLNSAPVVWIGTLSYSLYLWHQLFIGADLPAVAKLAGSVAVACASYYLVENPARRWLNGAHRADATPASGT